MDVAPLLAAVDSTAPAPATTRKRRIIRLEDEDTEQLDTTTTTTEEGLCLCVCVWSVLTPPSLTTERPLKTQKAEAASSSAPLSKPLDRKPPVARKPAPTTFAPAAPKSLATTRSPAQSSRRKTSETPAFGKRQSTAPTSATEVAALKAKLLKAELAARSALEKAKAAELKTDALSAAFQAKLAEAESKLSKSRIAMASCTTCFETKPSTLGFFCENSHPMCIECVFRSQIADLNLSLYIAGKVVQADASAKYRSTPPTCPTCRTGAMPSFESGSFFYYYNPEQVCGCVVCDARCRGSDAFSLFVAAGRDRRGRAEGDRPLGR
jgi:hypothetical protein